ncbi:DUF4179 domain-containing protein [Pseudoneobacillus sp. C159]
MMIQRKMDSMSITTLREHGVETVVDWFDQRKQSFYTLGWFFLRNRQQIEELFYRSIIKVQKELPRFKSETSFETWVTNIFLHTCRKLSDEGSFQDSEENEPLQAIIKALDRLNDYEKEAVALTYIKGISKEESAYLLQISVEKMKELLFSGIESLRKEMRQGSTFNGCKEYHSGYIDYLERSMDRSRKIDFEVHIYRCQECQEDLASFQDVMLTMSGLTDRMKDLHIPPSFMENIKDRLAEKERQRQQKNKKRTNTGLISTSVFTLLMAIVFFTGTFTNLYYTWTEENQELRAFLQQGLGESLNLEAESDGVKITIKSVISDEIQTLVFYKIEDTAEDNQFVMNNYDGVSVENEHLIMTGSTYPRYYLPDLKADINNTEKNVFHGKISLLPLRKDNGTIKLKITKLQKLIRDSSAPSGFMPYGNLEYKAGDWSFEIPVTKQPSVEYALDEKTEVEGVSIRFEKLISAPTATLLQYTINQQPTKRIDVLNFNHIEVNKKKVKAERYSNSFFTGSTFGTTYQAQFDPLLGEKPKEVKVQLESAQLAFNDQKNIELDAFGEYPQTFEYAGSILFIDKVEVGEPTNVVISNHKFENRTYDSLYFNIVGEGEVYPNSMEMDSEGVLVDKNGVEIDMSKAPFLYEQIEQPRHFVTVQNVKLQSNIPGEKLIPIRLEIYGYNTTKYLDDVVKISLK